MSMAFEAVAITSQQAEAVATDQELLDQLLYDDTDHAAAESAVPDPAGTGGAAPLSVDLDKSWHPFPAHP